MAQSINLTDSSGQMNLAAQHRAQKQQAEESMIQMKALCRRFSQEYVQSRIDARIAALPPMVAERRVMMIRRIISSEQINDMGVND